LIGARVSAINCFEVSSKQTRGISGLCGRTYFFLRVRPIVLSLARSTMFSSTTLFSNNRNVQRARPLGGFEQAKAISLASFSPSKIGGTAGVARFLRLNTAARPSSTNCLRTR